LEQLGEAAEKPPAQGSEASILTNSEATRPIEAPVQVEETAASVDIAAEGSEADSKATELGNALSGSELNGEGERVAEGASPDVVSVGETLLEAAETDRAPAERNGTEQAGREAEEAPKRTDGQGAESLVDERQPLADTENIERNIVGMPALSENVTSSSVSPVEVDSGAPRGNTSLAAEASSEVQKETEETTAEATGPGIQAGGEAVDKSLGDAIEAQADVRRDVSEVVAGVSAGTEGNLQEKTDDVKHSESSDQPVESEPPSEAKEIPRPLSVSGSPKESKGKGTGDSPKARGSPKSKESPKSVSSIGTAKQRGGRNGAKSVSSSGALRQGAGKDTEKGTSEQKMIKHLQKQARRAAAVKPAAANESETRGAVLGQVGDASNQTAQKTGGQNRVKEAVSEIERQEASSALGTVQANGTGSRRTSEALTPGDASQANAPSEGVVVSTEVAASEPASSGLERDSVQRKALLTVLDSATDGGVETGVSPEEAPTQQASVAVSAVEGNKLGAESGGLNEPALKGQQGETATDGKGKDETRKIAEEVAERTEESGQELEVQTEKGTETGNESDAKVVTDVVPKAGREEGKQLDGIPGGNTGNGTEPQAVGEALEIGEERLLQFSISVAATRESFERLAKREEEKIAEKPGRQASLGSQKGRPRGRSDGTTRGKQRGKGSVDKSPIDGASDEDSGDRLRRTGGGYGLRKEGGSKAGTPPRSPKLSPASSLKEGKKFALKPPPGQAWKARVAEERNGGRRSAEGRKSGRNSGRSSPSGSVGDRGKKEVILGRGLVPITTIDSKRRSGSEDWKKGLSSQGVARISGDGKAERTLSISDIELDSDSENEGKVLDRDEEEVGPREAWPATRDGVTEREADSAAEAERKETNAAEQAGSSAADEPSETLSKQTADSSSTSSAVPLPVDSASIRHEAPEDDVATVEGGSTPSDTTGKPIQTVVNPPGTAHQETNNAGPDVPVVPAHMTGTVTELGESADGENAPQSAAEAVDEASPPVSETAGETDVIADVIADVAAASEGGAEEATKRLSATRSDPGALDTGDGSPEKRRHRNSTPAALQRGEDSTERHVSCQSDAGRKGDGEVGCKVHFEVREKSINC
jgi:hypothetical protein